MKALIHAVLPLSLILVVAASGRTALGSGDQKKPGGAEKCRQCEKSDGKCRESAKPDYKCRECEKPGEKPPRGHDPTDRCRQRAKPSDECRECQKPDEKCPGDVGPEDKCRQCEKPNVRCSQSNGPNRKCPRGKKVAPRSAAEARVKAHFRYAKLGSAHYTAMQLRGKVFIRATGASPTDGYKDFLWQLPGGRFPPEFALVWIPPKGPVIRRQQPFTEHAMFSAPLKVDKVVVHDRDGRHEIPVAQASSGLSALGGGRQ